MTPPLILWPSNLQLKKYIFNYLTTLKKRYEAVTQLFEKASLYKVSFTDRGGEKWRWVLPGRGTKGNFWVRCFVVGAINKRATDIVWGFHNQWMETQTVFVLVNETTFFSFVSPTWRIKFSSEALERLLNKRTVFVWKRHRVLHSFIILILVF